MEKLYVNRKLIRQKYFAFDGCHKIYLLDEDDVMEFLSNGYRILPIEELEETFNKSCSFRFIENGKLDKTYVGQCQKAKFTYKK